MNTTPANGSERKNRSAAGNLADFFRDLVALIELQGLLFLVDAGDEFRKARRALLLLAALAVIVASCFPLGLAGLALVLAEETRLTMGQALLCVAAGGGLLSCAGIYLAARRANPGAECLQRSRAEWRCNVKWLKDTLKNFGDGRPGARAAHPESLRR